MSKGTRHGHTTGTVHHPTAARVAVTGIGLLSPLGDAAETLHAALCRGNSALRPLHEMPDDGELPEALRPAIEGRLGAPIEGFSPFDYLGKRNFRPLDRTGRLTTVAAHLALEQAGWTPERRAEDEVGLVLGTMFGSVRTIVQFDKRALELGPQYAKPLDFANTVINAAAGQAAIWHDLRGLNSTLCAGSTSGLQALAYATEMVRSGRSGPVLAGGAEELSLPSFFGFLRTGRMTGGPDLSGSASNGPGAERAATQTQRPVPFDTGRDGFALGEGAALLMLEPLAAARERDAQIHAELVGHGNAFDPSRGRDAESAADAVARAIAIALDDAQVQIDDIDAVSCSANGSPAGDQHEAAGLALAFRSCTSLPPVTAVKSMLGEALGAGPALQTVALITALAQGELPGVHGLEQLPDAFPLPVQATCQPLRQRPAGSTSVRRGLVTALGLDGNACALILQREDEAS